MNSIDREPCDLIVRNAYLITMNAERAIYPRGALAVTDGQIVAVDREQAVLDTFSPERTVDARGAPVHPGFIETHVHITQHNFRFAFTGGLRWHAVLDFFYTGWLPVITPEEEHASSLLACLEMARNGTTAFLEGDTIFDRDAAASAIEAVGIRGSLGDPWVMDTGPVVAGRIPETTDEAISLLGSQLERNRDPNALVQGHVSVIGHGSASDELELAAKACADEHGAILNQHQSYGDDDTFADDEKRGGRHVLRHFADLGLLDRNCTFAHMNVVREDEIQPVVGSGMSVAWCPTASMVYGMGGAISGRHLELYEQGANVSLGSDAPNWAGPLDVGEQGFVALLTSREKTRRGDALDAEDVLTMATVNGARSMGMDDRIGSLEVGKRADLVIRRDDLPEAQPGLDPIRGLVLSCRAKAVRTVIVNGKTIVEDGHAVCVDEEQVYRGARHAARDMLARMGHAIDPRWPIYD
jgi:cytosine/adenosine deaminase-related metal-dependent hydrolase